MAGGPNKRKQGPGGGGDAPYKKAKGGKGGRWKTPFEQAKAGVKIEMGRTMEIGDAGIWVTFARGMRSKAMREFTELCEEYGKELYGITPPSEEEAAEEVKDDEAQDIEASIKQELESLKTSQRPKTRRPFTPIMTSLECLFFMKTIKPVDPEALARKICEDARDCPNPMLRRTKYINRLTPVTDTDKATEKGIERVARSVLAPWFALKSEDGDDGKQGVEGDSTDGAPACTYAIRYNVRNHDTFKSSDIVNKVAGLVKPQHKVNLTNPDKVILVDIYTFHCGVCVVEGRRWEDLKRYNVNEMYRLEDPSKEQEKKKDTGQGEKSEAMTQDQK